MFHESQSGPLLIEDHKEDADAEICDLELNISYDAVLVIVIAGPGIGKEETKKAIGRKFPTFLFVNVSYLLRDKTQKETKKGVEKWTTAASMINRGDLVQDSVVLEVLITKMNENVNVEGYVIEGYPRNGKQLAHFEKYIGQDRLHFVVVVDCEESTCQKVLLHRLPKPGWSDHVVTAISQRISNYKAHTLCVLKYFDDNQKLKLVNGDRTKEDVVKDILRIFRMELPEFEKSSVPTDVFNDKVSRTHGPEIVMVEDIPELFNIGYEIKRPKEFPQCPIVLLLGGPGSGKTDVAREVCAHFQDWVHMDVNSAIRDRIFDNGIQSQNWNFLAKLNAKNGAVLLQDQLVVEYWDVNIEFISAEMKTLPSSTPGIIMEGFPKDGLQLNQYNSEFGRADLVILLDCDEYSMTLRLSERSERLHRPDDEVYNARRRIAFYKEKGLAISRYYDERHRLNIVSGDMKAVEVTKDVVCLVERAIMTHRCLETISLVPKV